MLTGDFALGCMTRSSGRVAEPARSGHLVSAATSAARAQHGRDSDCVGGGGVEHAVPAAPHGGQHGEPRVGLDRGDGAAVDIRVEQQFGVDCPQPAPGDGDRVRSAEVVGGGRLRPAGQADLADHDGAPVATR